MKKFLTIALLVMALCVVSVAVSAAPTASCRNSVATVIADEAAAAGQTVILVVGEKEDGTLYSQADLGTAETTVLEGDIIYVDQATVSQGEKKSFTFVPRVLTGDKPYADDATVFLSDGSTVTATPVYLGNTYTVTLNANGGVLPDADKTVEVRGDDATGKTLPTTATKVGYKFDGWYDNAECTGTAITTVNKDTVKSDVTYYAKWSAYFGAVTENEGSINDTVDYEANEGNLLADTGYLTDANGDIVEYVVSVTAEVAAEVEGITEYGFFVYNHEGKSVSNSVTASIPAGAKFHVYATGIPTTATDAYLYFKPFVKIGGEYCWGKGYGYTVNGLKGDSDGKYLGKTE